jgi:hypothetical protein
VEGYGGSGRIDESGAALNKQFKAILQRFIGNRLPNFNLGPRSLKYSIRRFRRW